jgi:hypothetical protein
MPGYTTIIVPIEEQRANDCRHYLRDNVEPSCTTAGLQCSKKFPFHLIPTLHFCSFIVLHENDFGPNLVFEATFDGSRDDFLSDLMQVAPDGMHELFSHCVGYPCSDSAIPHIAREYLARHDAGAHAFFCGNPGRTVAQIKDEEGLRAAIVQHLSGLGIGSAVPPRLNPLFEVLQDFLRSKKSHRWAEQPAPVPWEIRFRTAIVVAAAVAVLIAAYVFGVAVAPLIGAVMVALVGWSPSVEGVVFTILNETNQFGAAILAHLQPIIPVNGKLADVLKPAIPLIGLIAIWLFLRVMEVLFSSWTRHPRDQLFRLRFPLHLAVILRYGTLLLLAGAVALALIRQIETPAPPGDVSTLRPSLGLLVGIALALPLLQYLADTLRLSVQFNKLKAKRERWRRLWLDLIGFTMAVLLSVSILIIARYVHMRFDTAIATSFVHAFLVAVAYALIGILAAYGLGLILFLLVHRIELLDRRKFFDPAMLQENALGNAPKYAREEGGNNSLQNHLASMTHVKPGFVRICLLRGTLFIINLLSRFWFNRGELGGIPTILSARWVLIDGGRRLLFLDNYGGAWESYLNEFIDMTAVKGLNAIWTNTFVKAGGNGYGFPETRFLFWRGAQAERPFKDYVRQSQIETIAWYSAYPTLSVVNINTTSELRQLLCKPLTAPKIDAIVQNL